MLPQVDLRRARHSPLLVQEHLQIPLIVFECADWLIRMHLSVKTVALVKIITEDLENARLIICHSNKEKVRLFLRNS